MLLVACLAALTGCVGEGASSGAGELSGASSSTDSAAAQSDARLDNQSGAQSVDLASLPSYTGSPFVELNDNTPSFSDADKSRGSFEEYAPLDDLGRCGVAFALVGAETMPTEERESIGSVKPTGWHLSPYEGIDGRYLFNRCHLIGFQLAGENANERNLITGTRYLNVEGMLPFENEVANYVDRTGNHVLYRVTPLFAGDELVARGVQMEALSVEDGGAGVCFNVFCYNVQPGIAIDYATGENWAEEQSPAAEPKANASGNADVQVDYVLNTNTGKFHVPSCSSVDDIKPKNRQDFRGLRSDVVAQGYAPCGRCNP